MQTIGKPLRVLIVDDNRDGADTLGLLIEELGNQVQVTYGGAYALDVAATFRPDLMLVDLLMPHMDGIDLVKRLRQIPDFAHTQIVAITGLKDEEYRTLATKSGCDAVLGKPIALNQIKAVLAGLVPAVTHPGTWSQQTKERASLGAVRRLPLDQTRRIRNSRSSGGLTQVEREAAICDRIGRFQEEYFGWKSEQIHVHLIRELVLVCIHGVLTCTEQQLGKSLSPEKGSEFIRQARKQLLELARPMLESLVQEAVGVRVLSMHHNISSVTGEEVVIFSWLQHLASNENQFVRPCQPCFSLVRSIRHRFC